MRVLVVYDSSFGNTEKIAQAIGNAIVGDARVARAEGLDFGGIEPVDLLIVGSPTQGGRPTPPIQDFLDRIPATALKDTKVASFDTRYRGRFVKLFGFAADRIAESLKSKGGILVSPPVAFYVTGKRGPLEEGELERAIAWAKGIAQ